MGVAHRVLGGEVKLRWLLLVAIAAAVEAIAGAVRAWALEKAKAEEPKD